MALELFKDYLTYALPLLAGLILLVGPVLLHCEWRYRRELKEARQRAERIEHPWLTANREGLGLGLRTAPPAPSGVSLERPTRTLARREEPR